MELTTGIINEDLFDLEAELTWYPSDAGFVDTLVAHPKKVATLTSLYDIKVKQRDTLEIAIRAKKAALWEDIKKNQQEDGKPLSDTRVANRVESDPAIVKLQNEAVELTYELKHYQNAIARFNDRKEMMKIYVGMLTANRPF